MSCEYGLSVYMIVPGICILFLADTCVSQMHQVFNHVVPYGYLFPIVGIEQTKMGSVWQADEWKGV